MNAVTLIDAAFSPWSEKVRWILDRKGIPYEREEYVPVFGDGRLKRLTGQAEIPVIVDEDGRAIADSTRIFHHLEAKAPEPSLLPEDARARAEALRWQDWAGDSLGPTARFIVTDQVARDGEAARATIPPTAGALLRRFAGISVAVGLRLFKSQYDITDEAVAKARWRLPLLLRALEAALPPDGDGFLVGDALSIADIAVASMFTLIDAPADEYLPRPMPPALRRGFTIPFARADFPRAISWRDKLYERCRRPEPTPVGR